jgi:large subunit ribosomal protein L13
MQKSYMAKKPEVTHEWLLVDASDMPIGRLASQVATILRGKHKPTFTPHEDVGDYVVIINSDKVILTGNKMRDKTYFKHTGFIGNAHYVPAKQMIEEKSDYIVQRTIKGMLPKNAIGRAMIKKLKVYKGAEHEHQAQKPRKIELVGKRTAGGKA